MSRAIVRFPEELLYWRKLIIEIQEHITIAEISKRVLAPERVVWSWKKPTCRPTGLRAVRLYLLHVKLCSNRQCDPLQIADA